MIFAAVSGSSVATTFAIGAILIPALIKHGYPTSYAAALQATSAELGVIIPPSIPMILYGVSAEVSIGELFISGFGPGLLIGMALMIGVLALRELNEGSSQITVQGARYSSAMQALKVDHALKEGTQIGPVVDEAQMAQDENYIRIGRDEGAKLAWGGERLKDDASLRSEIHAIESMILR